MSKFTFDKFKEVREAAADGSASSPAPAEPQLLRDVSPIKERLLCKFARLAPGDSSLVEQEETVESSSWIRQVKGRLAKTVDTSLERYAELRAERARLARCPPEQSASLDLEDGTSSEVEGGRRLSHSHSDMVLSKEEDTTANTSSRHQPRPHSQIFDLDISDWSIENCPKEPSVETSSIKLGSSAPSSFLPPAEQAATNSGPANTPTGFAAPADMPTGSVAPADTPTSSAAPADTPTKTRKRFALPFMDRSGSASGSPTKSETAETPRRSFRSLMKSYVTKSPQEEKTAPIPIPSSPTGDPFSGIEFFDATSQDFPDAEGDMSGLYIEEAVEAEDLIYTPEPKMEAEDESQHPPEAEPPVLHTNSLSDLVNPVLVGIFIVLNFTGLFPAWISGFLSGMIISTLLIIWILLRLYPPVSYTRTPRPLPCRHIPIDEPSPLVQSWMNLLPHQFHPYHVDTYEVKNTISVRVTIEHQMLKIEYPEKNIPKRLNSDEVIPTDLKFHFHTDHIDLTTAKISLLPEGIAGKRMFSKKYPIEIRPNGGRPPDCSPIGSPQHKLTNTTTTTTSPSSSSPTAETRRSFASIRRRSLPRKKVKLYGSPLDSDGEDSLADIDDGLEDDSPGEWLEGNKKVYYLFARADREKEDMYKALLEGHFFLADTFLDVTRRQNNSSSSRRETVRERKANFSQYMSQILEHLSPSGSSSGPDSTPEQQQQLPPPGDGCITFFNIFLHRIFYDIHKSEEMRTWLKSRIYNKLLKIKITQWFKQISLTEIHIGSNLPKILSVSRPTQNERGLWVELGVEYRGLASATIETCGLNLGEEQVEAGAVHLKDLLEENQDALHIQPASPRNDRKISSRIEAATNSDEEDSAESDSEESGEVPGGGPGPILPVPGPVADQQAVPRPRWWEVVGNSELVKSGINRLSNTEWWKEKTSKKMTLQLEITSLKGVVVLNIAPPPTDRLWYGFKSRPEIGLRILPYYGDTKLGEDNTFFSTAVNKGIEVLVNRLKEEIHKFILLPNMDDLPIRLMSALPATNLDIKMD